MKTIKIRIHWNLFKKQFTLHSYKSCTNPDVILVTGKWLTELKPHNKSNPRGFVLLDSNDVISEPSAEIISQYIKSDRLIYDKDLIKFNFTCGDGLICDSSGCYLVKKSFNKIEN